MAESNTSDDRMVELDEYKENGDDGFKYKQFGKQGSTSAQNILIFGKIPLTLVLFFLTVLLLVNVVLQVVIMAVINRTTPEVPTTDTSSALLSSQLSQFMENFNSTPNGGGMEQTKGQDPILLEHLNNNSMLLNQLYNATHSSAEKLRNIVQTLSNLNQFMANLMEQTEKEDNNTMLLNQLFDVTQSSAQKLRNIVQTLSNLEDTSDSTMGAVDDILVIAEELLKLQNGNPDVLFRHFNSSCQDLRDNDPNNPSGYYYINGELVYCEMGELCGVEGAWTRIGYLDMADSTQNCPANFSLYEGSGVRGCGRYSTTRCVSVKLPSNGISYSEVCGRVIGYQYGSPDADDTRFLSPSVHNDINQNYMDGVSITTGYPRQHIWSLMAGVYENTYDYGNCPCNFPPSSTQRVQSFVGDDYFCESGNPNFSFTTQVYADDPLWDGEGCGTQEQDCCTNSTAPWFYRSINSTTDYIELRECGDEPTWNEDVLVSFYEIYVK